MYGDEVSDFNLDNMPVWAQNIVILIIYSILWLIVYYPFALVGRLIGVRLSLRFSRALLRGAALGAATYGYFTLKDSMRNVRVES